MWNFYFEIFYKDMTDKTHPLLEELLQLCLTLSVEPALAYNTFEVYQELSEVRKLADLKYSFSEELKQFYLLGKIETTDEYPSIFVPVMYNDKLSPEKIEALQEISPDHKQIYLFIRDTDSSSTCYCIKKGLVKPDSPETHKKRKEFEWKKYQFDKNIQNYRKLFYTKALKQKKTEEYSKKD